MRRALGKLCLAVAKGSFRWYQGLGSVGAVLWVVLATVAPVGAATYQVTTLSDAVANDGQCSLREAIQEANNGADTDCTGTPSAGNDTITFSVSGTIVLSSTLPNIVSGQGTLTIDGGGNITISGNNSVRVMIVDLGADLTLQNLTVAHGNVSGSGGGVYNLGTLTVTNSTFSGNSASSGGGIESFSGTLTLNNTLIANSTSGGDCVGTLSGSNINNLIEDSANACGLVNGVNGNIIGQDPNLGALTGSPAYFPLNPGSPALDTGDNATCPNPPVNNQSQNGVTRPQDGDGNGTAICDIGSFELPAQQPSQADMQAALGSLPPSLGPGSVYPGLTFTCSNNGPGSASNATCSIAASAGTVSSVSCTPSVPVASLASGASISCTYSFTAPGTAGGGNTPETGVTFTVTTGADNDSNASNNTASNASPVPLVDALDEAATLPAGTTQSYNVGANDQYGPGGLPGTATFSLQPGTTCGSASINNSGVATFQVPASGSCVVAYRVCVTSGCDTAQLSVTAQQQLEPIPTLDDWGLLAFIVLTLGVGILMLRRVMG